jgi:serine/threonine-protein kinase
MRSREEFGQYLLLKRLSEDALGESFRAGRLGPQGLQQVVLLRVFNGRGLDAARLWQRVAGRAAVHKALKSPHIGNGVDLGEVRGVPFVAYDYISGKNLENLLLQASSTNSPIPADHALLIAERMALALAVAGETRAGEERVLHGFAVPHLVMVSNEGETRVLGFEMAPGLAEQAGSLGPDINRYLAPEVVAGGKPERSDEVFSLGAVLYELLACKPLPEASPAGYGAALEGARVAYDGSPLPAEVGALLGRSLAPRGQRLPDAASWHKALTQVMTDGGSTATTFNLAFFMHNLFRQEIEQEGREIEQEKAISRPAAAAPAAPPAPAAEAAGGAATLAAEPAEGEKRGSRVGLIAAAAAVVLALGAVGGWLTLRGGGDGDGTAAAAQPAGMVPVPATIQDPRPVEPAGPSPEEIQSQLAAMIDTRSSEMESKLRGQYDQKIKELQSQLQDAQQAAVQREAEARERQRQEAERRVREAEDLAAAKKAAAAQQAAAEPLPTEGAAAAADGTTGGGEPAAAQTTAPRPADNEPAAAPVKTEPAPPQVRVGDLVSLGPGVTPPVLSRNPQLRYPPMARKMNRQAEVDVRVLVDENGNVQEAELIGKKVGLGFDEAALDAARSAEYKPAVKGGVRVKMYVNLKIRFDL